MRHLTLIAAIALLLLAGCAAPQSDLTPTPTRVPLFDFATSTPVPEATTTPLPEFWIDIPVNSSQQLSYFVVENQTTLSFKFNTRDFSFIRNEFLYDLSLPKESDAIQLVFIPVVDFEPESADTYEQVRIEQDSDHTIVYLAIGKTIQDLERDQTPEYRDYATRSVSYLFVYSLTQLGVLRGTYTEEQAHDIQIWYIRVSLSNSMFVIVRDLSLSNTP